MRVEDERPDVGFVGDPAQLIDVQLGAVRGFGEPGLGQQVFECDGDDDRGRYPTHRWQVGGL